VLKHYASLLTLAFLIVGVATASLAQTDANTLIKAKKFDDAEKILKAKLTANPQDDSSHFYLGTILADDRYDEAIEHLEKCVELKPQDSGYYLWLGRAYGMKAQNAGLTGGIRYAGKVKDAFLKAVELDPKSFEARYALNQYYLQAPGIVGGSVRKAKANAADFASVNLAQSRLLWAAVHTYEKDFDKAEGQLTSIGSPSDDLTKSYLRGRYFELAFGYLDDKQPEKAQKIFEQLVAAYPDNAYAYHGLGRAYFDQKKFDESIPFFEKAVALDKSISSFYRLGLVYQIKGEKKKAIDYFEQFLALKPVPQGNAADDAKDRLAELKK
jgi:tetratricopeptide (TPR) repeat protein